MKYAVDRSLDGKKYETADIGESLARVLRYWTVRGKFDSVHPELEKIGVQRIEITATGLKFVGDIASNLVKLSGLEWRATERDVRLFLGDCGVQAVVMMLTAGGKPSGDAVVKLHTEEDVTRALGHNRQMLGERFVIVQEVEGPDNDQVDTAHASSSSGN